MSGRHKDTGASGLGHAHANRVLTGAQSGGSEAYGSGDKSEVLELFLKDSLNVAKRQVIKDMSHSSSRHRHHSSLREKLPPVNEDKPSSAIGYSRLDSRQRALEHAQLYAEDQNNKYGQAKGRRRPSDTSGGHNPYKTDMIEQARHAVGGHAGVSKELAAFLEQDDVSVVSSKMTTGTRMTTGTNAGFWKKGPQSVAPSAYPTTAVTSRVESAVLLETMERLERLERDLKEEQNRREQTESQLNKLKGTLTRRKDLPPPPPAHTTGRSGRMGRERPPRYDRANTTMGRTMAQRAYEQANDERRMAAAPVWLRG
mmetsp:Transcript_25039/g.54482  ORF Transcript_25039/g.54482 Transcript_25039/m.54482 type:complete len:313 (-) Transcript_25039:26-964(-)|eukprot:CAMPEP_0118950270 /NCGR_PEP_ID=MMETSP1169-20130426/51091_1 /TAXON_ID=36882 /ORGANISM="Pyramimonas obovata, Strain CCMP722" /LENGTH=312 /DNA_ID=CAMNT_0006897075 /DNA_START=151 /DNA_END=1089 /DNA_ORIENTATION=-